MPVPTVHVDTKKKQIGNYVTHKFLNFYIRKKTKLRRPVKHETYSLKNGVGKKDEWVGVRARVCVCVRTCVHATTFCPCNHLET